MANSTPVIVKIGAVFDSTFKSVMSNADKSVGNLGTSLSKLEKASKNLKGIDDLQKKTKELPAQIRAVSKEFETAKSKTDLLGRSWITLDQEINKLTSDLAKQKDALKANSNASASEKDALRLAARELAAKKKELNNLSKEYKEAAKASGTLDRALREQVTELGQSRSKLSAMRTEARAAGADMRNLGSAIESADKKLARAHGHHCATFVLHILTSSAKV